MQSFHRALFTALFTVFIGSTLFSQQFLKMIDFDPDETLYKELLYSPFVAEGSPETFDSETTEVLSDGLVFSLDPKAYSDLFNHNGNKIQLRVPYEENRFFTLQLKEVNIFQDEVKIKTASKPDQPFEDFKGRFFWGVVKGEVNSKVSISLFEDHLMGFISFRGQNFSLAKLDNDRQKRHIIYEERDLLIQNDFVCHVDEEIHYIGSEEPGSGRTSDSSNCVNVYVEVDHDIYQGKGSVGSASSYVLGAFSQVFLLYADESIEANVSEILVWDVPSPYTGPSSSQYLSQFRQELNGNYNGDLAHLVSYSASGGVAYLDVLCNSYWGVAFSSIHSTYNNVPTYSWTVMVIAHEMGHNLGSRHTHDCVWNGNDTPIDCCGQNAGYDGTFCSSNQNNNCNISNPSNGGTIMSYCHLIGGVGINFNEGFGQQPGDLMRDNVYDATCLEVCPSDGHDAGITGFTVPHAFTCDSVFEPELTLFNFGSETLTSVDIYYSINGGPDQVINWTGDLETLESESVLLPEQTFSAGSHDIYAYTDQPNGEDDENPDNDDYLHEFTIGSVPFTLTIVLDNYPGETSWDVKNSDGDVLFSAGPYSNQPANSTVVETFCLEENECYEYTIYDSFGDGICCAWGEGSYELVNDITSEVVASGGEFGFEETTPFCADITLYSISGIIQADVGDPLEDAEVVILSNNEEEQMKSNADGQYEFEVNSETDNILSVEKEDLSTAGLSTMDLLLIQKSIINSEVLTDPYQIIAADVNMDQKVNTIDLILLHQRVLGIIDEFSHGESWIFIPENHSFTNPQDPLSEGWPETMEFNEIEEDFEDQNWIAIKIGDVNGDYFPSNQRMVRFEYPLLVSGNPGSKHTSNKFHKLDFKAGEEKSISGFQIEFSNPLNWSMDQIEWVSNLPNSGGENLFIDQKSQSIRISWWNSEPVKLDKGTPLFSLKLSEGLSLEDLKNNFAIPQKGSLWSSELYNDHLEVFRPVLAWEDGDVLEDFALFQNRPNPFSGQTTIPFRLPEDMKVDLEIWDESGRMIRHFEINGSEGMNHFTLDFEEGRQGVYYYRLKAVNWEGTKTLFTTQ